VLDRDMEIIRANAATSRTFEAATKGTQLARILRDPGLLAAVNSALQTENGSQVVFSPAAARDKRFAARVEPIELAGREPGILISLRELTEQVLIERMRSDFVANASHEIRTPLASLQGTIETLRGPARDDPVARETFLATMAEETARMNRLVDDLLFLSRIELAALRPPSEICDLEPIVKRAVETMTPIAERDGIDLHCECATDLPKLRADADHLDQMILNFLDNAFKYGGQGTQVNLTVEALSHAPQTAGPLTGRASVMIAVSDNGPGIPAEHIPRLTERFYRVDTARSRRVGGTGLGLAIIKHILRRHDGHLAITSELGAGSTFTVYLPQALAEANDPNN
ncbi:MAG: ATP-binding protein, partial [Pseudomonadota bacterium]